MGGEKKEEKGPDLRTGVALKDLKEGEAFAGQVDGEAALLVRVGDEVFAIGATCTHYSGPLAEGLVVGTTVRCPWHHACFSLKTGEALRAPALNPVTCYQVEQKDGRVRVTGAREIPPKPQPAKDPKSVVIVGAGAAGAACADMLRACGSKASIALIGDEPPGPVDRPNLSKEYLAGKAPEEWIPLRSREDYESKQIEFLVDDPVAAVDPKAREVTLASGRKLSYEGLVLATGSEPKEPKGLSAGAKSSVHLLRTLADSRSIIAAASKAKTAVVIGASFIGLEVAASLRQRQIEVTVVGPEKVPLERVLGRELGEFVRKLHEKNGVRFRLGEAPAAIAAGQVTMPGGEVLRADLIVAGVGVSPDTALAEAAGLRVENGVVVDQHLRSSEPDVYAAGDIARYPEFVSGESARIEHWVTAERQGQAAARALLGEQEPYQDVPFFWSAHYDLSIVYIGHAPKFDRVEIRGDLEAANARAIYYRGDRILAVATIGQDLVSLQAEAALEQGDTVRLRQVLEGS